ncbi:hypothetical protein [Streptomyces cyanogenus]|uniref:Uncharacterized protein n=1 Tax=Streptomyces cyanogenus TaxID=80860 RepID=A0ABX7TKB5_STRCY|nr:hypothetical protein [Streptomyces cyanogenus]QTD97031.1 hypothetical protein S1361_06680 [Streptomyces cyanogenus]
MTAAVDPADETHPAIVSLRARVAELEAQLVALERTNFELKAAAETSRNFRADRAAGHIIDLDNWGQP